MIVLWLAMPNGEGASFLYRSYINPFIVQHQSQIDNMFTPWISRIRGFLVSVLQETTQRATEYMQQQQRYPHNQAVEFEEISNVGGPRIVEITASPKKK